MWYGRWGESRFGAVWYGKVGRVVASYGEARLGEFRQARYGESAWGGARHGEVGSGKAGLESQKGVDVEVGRNGRKAVFILGEQVQSTC